jgi:hypothetical protein
MAYKEDMRNMYKDLTGKVERKRSVRRSSLMWKDMDLGKLFTRECTGLIWLRIQDTIMNPPLVSIKTNWITYGLCRKTLLHGNRYVTLSCRRRAETGKSVHCNANNSRNTPSLFIETKREIPDRDLGDSDRNISFWRLRQRSICWLLIITPWP